MNKQRAENIYLIINVLGLLFMVYIIAWLLNWGGLQQWMRGTNFYWVSLIGYILLANGLNRYARKVGGGMINPMRTVARARYLQYVSLIFFFGGVLAGLYVDRNFSYISALAIPITALRIYWAHYGEVEQEETDIIDDFQLDE